MDQNSTKMFWILGKKISKSITNLEILKTPESSMFVWAARDKTPIQSSLSKRESLLGHITIQA